MSEARTHNSVHEARRPRRRSLRWQFAAAGAAIALLGAGCSTSSMEGILDRPPADSTIPAPDTDPTDGESPPAEESVDPPAVDSTVPAPDAGPAGAFDLDETMIEQAIAEALATPLEDIESPGRNVVATSLIIEELSTAGFDLTGLEIVVYPSTASESFLVLVSDDSTALVSVEDGFEPFLTELLASPSVALFGVQRLVLQHSGADDEGPFVATFVAELSDLQEGLDTGVEIFDRVAVQAERL